MEGYGGQRLMNPDKWFNWKALSVAEHACVIDAPLFSYRVHNANQNTLQAKAGALKHLVDQYAATLGRWFGVSDGQLDVIFPNLRNFAQRDVGFML